MALHRGIQSAIFYYVSCAPCAEARVRKKRRQEAERDRANRAELELDMPGLYHHPEPSSTNPHWQTEIEAGPIPSRTKKKLAEKSARASSTRSNIASSVSVDASLSMERSDSALSGMGPYQRNDEVLWGSRISDLARSRPSRTNSAQDGLPARLPRAALRDRTRNHISSNPAINDLHPPTTRKIESKEEVMWMMQPPPMPDIMNGKTVSQRSNSTTSRSVSTKGKVSSRPSSQRTPGSPEITPMEARPHSASKYLEVPLRLTRSRTLPGRHQQSELPRSGTHTTIRKPSPSLQLSQPDSETFLRPSLNTIVSENAGHDRYENLPHRSSSVNDQRKKQTQGPRPGVPLVKRQSPAMVVDSSDEHENADALECWTKPGFELPQWIHEHTKREVRERWSFDI